MARKLSSETKLKRKACTGEGKHACRCGTSAFLFSSKTSQV